jgi:cytidylate kinase
MINPNLVRAANAYIVSQSKKQAKPFGKAIDKAAQPFITISRETGAGGTTVGELLVEYLNCRDDIESRRWKLYDKNLIQKVIEDHKLPELYSDFLNETRISEIQDTFETLMGLHPGMSQLAKKTCSTILNLASIGNVVIVGRGANIITRNLPGGFHVRLIADHEWKVNQIESIFNLKRKEAARYIDEEDLRRREYVKKLFNRNVSDPMMYDIVIKTSSISFAETAEIIGERVLRLKQFQKLQAVE